MSMRMSFLNYYKTHPGKSYCILIQSNEYDVDIINLRIKDRINRNDEYQYRRKNVQRITLLVVKFEIKMAGANDYFDNIFA